MTKTMSPYNYSRRKQPWSYEKKITLAAIAFIVFHTLGAFFYAGTLDNKVANLSEQNQEIKSDIRDIRNYIMDKK